MAPAEQAVRRTAFLSVPTREKPRCVLNAHPGLLNVGAGLIGVMATGPDDAYPHQAVLVRCQQVGVARALAGLSRRR